ncbi:glycoside hydrolase family 3 C-terminal domain-containing protein [Glutamicibacter sp. NPDC087344]|uniref:glycoside hydrolase family 3 C-terminal domain-containing protein n=1 Tax=Glutamicibacter sp. NPDC087344 TaxID=3363994 RepID=UPI00380608A9
MSTDFQHGDPAEIVAGLSLEQKASLTSGANFWETKAVPEAGIPSMLLTDGPHGVRKQQEGNDHLGLAQSVPATCFPPAVGMGSTFDPQLLTRVGQALGAEARAAQVAVLLGPGINIKRSVLCGRNFEYLSEDPQLSGSLGAALVHGVQSQGVGTSLKHFALNNQESDRLRVSAEVDQRTMREIYLKGFEKVVTQEQPWTVMCSYNRINGVYASENRWLLTEVLREQWGFDGLVVSDWGAVDTRTNALHAGLDLEMPSSNGRTDQEIIEAVRNGELDEADVDLAAERMVRLAQRAAVAAGQPPVEVDFDAHHALAREVAGRSMVLLKNEDSLLPLNPADSVAVIGEFARTARYQGAGSSLINPTRVDCALDAIRERHENAELVSFEPGFTLEGRDPELEAGAVAAARAAKTAVLFLGLPGAEESEGFDREHIELPAAQLELLAKVFEANPRTVVVLSNGGVVRLGFADQVPAILEGWLLGQAGGSATSDVLFGDVNPSGRLAETIPQRLEDSPAYLDFPGDQGKVRYSEGLFVGYRWYDARALEVAFPFGHGLSYTEFSYGPLAVAATAEGITATVQVTNTGTRDGREVPQLYVSVKDSAVQRAPRELKGFANVQIPAGETREVSFTVSRADLAYWNLKAERFVVEDAEYLFEVGASSRDLRSAASLKLEGDAVGQSLDLNSTIAELIKHPVAGPMARGALSAFIGEGEAEGEVLKLMGSFPIGRMSSFTPDLQREDLLQLLQQANASA